MGSRLEKNSQAVRKRIESHTFNDEEGEEYEGSKFGGFADYFRRKKIKLQNLDAHLRSSSAGDKPQIFKGIVAHVNGYTQPSLQDLHQLIVIHGGGIMQYLDGKTTVTHIIAASLTPKKAVEFKRYRIVKPAWVVESVNAGRLLPWENYRVLDEGVRQNLIGFEGGKVVSQANSKQRGYRDQTNASWYTSQVREVAEDIDDDEGAHFPSTQPLLKNWDPAYSDYSDQRSRFSQPTAVRRDKAEEIIAEPETKLESSNPESFELTSSLEDALHAATAENSSRAPITADAEPMKDELDNPLPALGKTMQEAAEDPLDSERPRKRSRSASPSTPSKKAKHMTAEEHNAVLLADPHIRKSSTANPDFLKQYYSESRLHHLSTWKAELKSKFQQMASERSLSQRQPIKKRKAGSRRYVMHVDFDSFFCAVSLKSAPEYIDKPAVVAHGRGTGSEIASCNYPARKFGVKNGMWMQHALSLCADLKVLPYDFPAYEDASRLFYEAIIDVGGIVQSVSIDEALVDISEFCISAGGSDGTGVSEGSLWREQAKANEIAEKLRQRIKDTTGCAVSVGIGGNILLAKVALRRAKPAGQYQIKPEEILDFVGELLVQDLPGVAHSIGGKLEEIGVKYVKDVRSLTKDRLMTVLGPKTGEKIWDYSRGIDRTEVGEQVVRKSVSAEINWGIRFINQPEAEEFVQNLCGELQRRLENEGVKGRQLTMKIMRRAADAPLDPPKHLGHGKCDTFNKSVVLGVATNSADIIGKEAISILRSYGFSPGELRGLGVQLTRLESVKPSGAHPDGSQRRITFNTPAAKSKFQREVTDDPIDDPDSPQKPRQTPVHPVTFITKANEADSSAKKPLNLMGTQFLLPTQVDPSVLAELPPDIRSKLLTQGKPKSNPPSRSESPSAKSRSQSPAVQLEQPLLPSQLDPEVFDALPEDMKAEVLASYSMQDATPSRAAAQALQLQSPHKSRHPPTAKKQVTPTKKRTFLSRTRGAPKDSSSTLTQSNFLTTRRTDDDAAAAVDNLDEDFLAALPEDVRQEVIAEHRRARLAKRSGLVTSTRGPKRKIPDIPTGQRRIKLPPRPPKPTFTTSELSKLPELRETLNAWHREFRDEGPHVEDVRAMERYLRRVVLEEKNMEKAVGVVKWLAWVVGDDETASSLGRENWEEALRGIKDVVQSAVRDRGIGAVDFD